MRDEPLEGRQAVGRLLAILFRVFEDLSLLEFRAKKVAHERIYIMGGWEAAEWRAPWRANTPADPPPPPSR